MSDAVMYTSALPLARTTVEWVADLLAARQREIGTRAGRRALGCFDQAVMFLRWMIDAAKPVRLAADNAIGGSTAYRYLDEALSVVADQAPDLHQALLSAKDAGYGYVMIDGRADRHRPIPRDRPHHRR